MGNSTASRHTSRHLTVREPSPWVRRFAPLVPGKGRILDLACGNGRHARLFLSRGNTAVCVDRDVQAVADLDPRPDVEVIRADLEDGEGWPLDDQRFAGVVVVNYLFRPLFPRLLDALEPGGVLIYETFARGNERFYRPRNPDHLLREGELLRYALGRLQIVAYEHGINRSGPLPGVVQRLCAIKDLGTGGRPDGEPEPHPLVPENGAQ